MTCWPLAIAGQVFPYPDRRALMVHCHQRRRDRCTDYEGWGDSFQPGDSHPVLCHTRAITAGIQGTLQAARDRETRREPSTYPCVRAVPKLTVRVRFPSPAPHTKSVGTVG